MLDLRAIEQAALKVSAKLAELREKSGSAFNMSVAGRVLDDEIYGAKTELSRLLDHTTALALIAQLKAQADRIEALEEALKPFAKEAGPILNQTPEDSKAEVTWYKRRTYERFTLSTALTHAHFRTARQLLQKGGGDG